jgi:crotonobetainyl-CoA:carnitine CoA-transferase CaiB-like acyl-CoA transferase
MDKLPLERFSVIDLTRVRSGPTCVRQLADWGARVIKVEAVGPDSEIGGPRDGSDFQNLHRNKRSLTLDLKQASGREVFFSLVDRCDVIVENFRPDVKARLGIDYATVAERNARIVYGSISGFGQEGPYALRPGVDQIAQGMGGLMSLTGEPGRGPMRAGIAVADSTAGLYCALGILTALLEREVSGHGQWVQTSLLEAQIALLDFQAARWLVDHKVPKQVGNGHPTSVPTDMFATRDGHVNIAAVGDGMFARLCDVLGTRSWCEDPRFKTAKERYLHREELHRAVGEVLLSQITEHWVERLNRAGVPCGPVYNLQQVFEDPQVRELGIAQPVEHPRLGALQLVGQPVQLSRTPQRLCAAAPERGEHTDEILGELGYDAEQIARLRADNVV